MADQSPNAEAPAMVVFTAKLIYQSITQPIVTSANVVTVSISATETNSNSFIGIVHARSGISARARVSIEEVEAGDWSPSSISEG